jgi:hypothetical protein
MEQDSERQIPVIFLVGPPGAGKSSLGKRACRALDLRFNDLSTPAINEEPLSVQKKMLNEAIKKRVTDVIAIPWLLQNDKRIRTLVRRSGLVLLLWAHPLDMQARSGRAGPFLTPTRKSTINGGFGRNGVGCLEYRSLNRASDAVLNLVGRSLDEAAADLQYCIAGMRERSLQPPLIRTGLSDWVDDWHESYDIDESILRVMVDAMAHYLVYLRSEGKSERTLSGAYMDLQAAGMLVIGYDYYELKGGAELLDLFSDPPWTLEFERKFTDSPDALARYERNLRGFARFLKGSKGRHG